MLKKAIQKDIDHWIAKFPKGKQASAVVRALMIVQEDNDGYLTDDLISDVADYLSMPRISVAEVVSFYSLYNTHKVGKYKIYLCTNVSCLLRGSDEIKTHLENKLGISAGQTTADGKFTFNEVECLAACTGAPMCQINYDYYEDLTPKRMDEIIDGLE